uniref:C1q domain-containing protein n=1 Tax=Sander lucioperca TaxID=283035 RepID=A0A8C9XF26_SANLU
MKISVSITLLLLLGSVPESESAECQRAFPEDIYAVLRETTASLVQLKADMALLQTQGTVMNCLHRVIAVQKYPKGDKYVFFCVVEQIRQVAFSASLVAGSQAVTIGPFPSDTLLIYKHVPTNIGNAYNSNTGVFTAPVRGAYHFEWWVAAHGDNGAHASAAVLVKNSENVFMAYERQTQHFGTSSNGVTLLLEVGDVVFVRLVADTLAYDNANHHTTFSGFLLFPM